MHKVTVSLIDLEDGFINSFDELNYYLDLHTGRVVLVSESDRDLLEMARESLPDEDEVDVDGLGRILEEAGTPAWQMDATLAALPVLLDTSDRFCPIPQQPAWEAYSDMEAYIDSLGEGPLADRLAVAIQGKGAFRRFKDVLERDPAQREAWFSFERSRIRQRMVKWLESLEIEVEVVS